MTVIDCEIADTAIDFVPAWHSSDTGQGPGRQHFLVSFGNGKAVLLYNSNPAGPTIEDFRAVVIERSGDTVTWGTPYVIFPSGSEALGQEAPSGINAAPLVPTTGGEYVIVACGVNNSTFFILEIDGLSIVDRSATIVQNSAERPGCIQPVSDTQSLAFGFGSSLAFKRLVHSSLPDLTMTTEGTLLGSGASGLGNIWGWSYIPGAVPAILFHYLTHLRSVYDLAAIAPTISAATNIGVGGGTARLSSMTRFRVAPNGAVAGVFTFNYWQATMVAGQVSSVTAVDDASEGEFADSTGPGLSVLNGDYRGTIVTNDSDLAAFTAGFGFEIDPAIPSAFGAGDGAPSAQVDVGFNNTVRSGQMVDLGGGYSLVSALSNVPDTISLYLLKITPFPAEGGWLVGSIAI